MERKAAKGRHRFCRDRLLIDSDLLPMNWFVYLQSGSVLNILKKERKTVLRFQLAPGSGLIPYTPNGMPNVFPCLIFYFPLHSKLVLVTTMSLNKDLSSNLSLVDLNSWHRCLFPYIL